MKLLYTLIFLLTLDNFCFADSINQNNFPISPSMRVRVDFWKRVYTEIEASQAFLHDPEDLNFIYSTIELPSYQGRKRQRFIDAEKKKLANRLNEYARSPQPDHPLHPILKNVSSVQIQKMAKRIRMQQGLKDRYQHGLMLSLVHLDSIKQVFLDLGLPLELTFLPHVESSFNLNAVSKVGAAGMWQFMKSTAKLYRLRMDHLVDQRRDPILATKAAARVLKDNYRRFGSWPLAITAYNYGPAAINRAVRNTQSTDISEIIDRHQGRNFGFASKNFYATFLATTEISLNPEKYFKITNFEKLQPHNEETLTQSLPIKTLINQLAMTPEVFKNYNPAIRPVVFKKNMQLPKGFKLKIPQSHQQQWMAFAKNKNISIPKLPITPLPQREITSIGQDITVEYDETLGHFADWSGLNLEIIKQTNGLTRKKNIFPGLKITIPISPEKMTQFNIRRQNFHQKKQQKLFEKFAIDYIQDYQVEKGDNWSQIAQQFQIPMWLLKQHQQNKNEDLLRPGETLKIPILKEIVINP